MGRGHAWFEVNARLDHLTAGTPQVADRCGSDFHESSEITKPTPPDFRLIKSALGVKDLRHARYKDDIYSLLQQSLKINWGQNWGHI